jgi:hypothetical protein
MASTELVPVPVAGTGDPDTVSDVAETAPDSRRANAAQEPLPLEAHPLSDIFPLLGAAELAELAADIKQHTLIEPIVTYERKVLDGRNRYRACLLAGVRPRFKPFDGSDPLSFVISANLKRRHLSETQRAMVAAKIATLGLGSNQFEQKGPQICGPSLSAEQAAKQFTVSARSIESARKVREHGTEKLIDAAEQDKIPVSAAAHLCSREPEFQDRVIDKIIDEKLPPQEAIRAVIKEDIAKRGTTSLDGKYRVFYADPPWEYANSQPDYFGEQRDHYPTMPLEEICSEPIAEHAEDNAVLFLWATSPGLEDAFAVIKAWGFKYKASFVWDKVKHVMGHYNSVRHEFLLIAVRGSCQPDVRQTVRQRGVRRAHRA